MDPQERDYFEDLRREQLDPFSERSIREIDAQLEGDEREAFPNGWRQGERREQQCSNL